MKFALKPRKRELRILAYILLAIYGALFLFQRALLYPAAYRLHAPYGPARSYGLADFTDVTLVTGDGVHVGGWAHPPARPGGAVILYLFGNGGTIAARAPRYNLMAQAGYGVFALSYRGFGISEGKPTEQGLYADARAAIGWIKTHDPRSKIILFGESLGTGVAVQMAQEDPQDVAGIALQSPYSSIGARVAEIYWFLPGLRYLLLDHFDSLSKIAALHVPLLIMHGTADRVVPINHGVALARAAVADCTRFVWVPGEAHFMSDGPVMAQLETFLPAQGPPPAAAACGIAARQK